MFLRSLTLRGFKSFADKTVVEFAPGISVIVGPNGSGKSNVADAIAWVLGEQGPRALRGGQMTDVIFAGGPSRPRLGMAEVRMVIDNAIGLIPVPASEIEISRVVYRSGESEYRLGGRPCRLLDIQELLSDTGVGRSLHTIIGQGQLDAILGARPDERRQFVEEAAGIAKHRRRRERAERKLAGLEQDLLRLQDVVAELRRQLRPLKQQAELAQRHEDLTAEAAAITRKLAAARLHELYAERDRSRPAWERAKARDDEIQARLGALDAEIERLEEERQRKEEEGRAQDERHGAAVAAKSATEERLRAAIRAEAEAREQMTSAANRSGRLFALEEEVGRTESALSNVLAGLQEREGQLAHAEQEFQRARSARLDAEDERRRLGEESAAIKAETEALRRAVAAHDAERERLEATLAELRDRGAATADRAAGLQSEIEQLDGRVTPVAAEKERVDRHRSEVAGELADLEAEEKGLLARREVAVARSAELAESPGAAFLRRRGGGLGLLRDLVQVADDLRPALRAALGPFADAVVYADRGRAMADALAEPSGGITLAVEEGQEHTQPSLSWERSLLQVVRPDPRVRRLVGALVGDVYLVSNPAEAEAKNRVHPSLRFVTPEGTLIGPGFVRTAPGHDARLEEARRVIAAIDREFARLRSAIRDGRQRLAELTRRSDALAGELEGADGRITVAAEQLAATKGEAAMLEREADLIDDRLAAATTSRAVALAHLESIPDRPRDLPPLPPVPEPPIHLRVEAESLRRESARLRAGVDRARRELGDLAADDPVQLRAALRGAETSRGDAEEALAASESELNEAAAARRASGEAARQAQEAHAKAMRAWREQAGEAERVRRDHEDDDRARFDLERRVAEAERVVREGHGVEPPVAVGELGTEDTVEDLARRSDLVARRLGLIGRVNLLAGGELESVQERHDFISRELEDVRSARRDLERLIQDIDGKVAELFQAAFSDVAREFAGLFEAMFPGGEGRLTLTDPSDPLGTGIEVEARPSRGRVKRLSLLSGGERSLAALAFLFAIFRARPSPFYLMDEVEAALDDVNLHRFLEVVKALARDSQIMLVTHQKRTMEVADALYGVSMGQGGSSTVISQRLAEVAAS